MPSSFPSENETVSPTLYLTGRALGPKGLGCFLQWFPGYLSLCPSWGICRRLVCSLFGAGWRGGAGTLLLQTFYHQAQVRRALRGGEGCGSAIKREGSRRRPWGS